MSVTINGPELDPELILAHEPFVRIKGELVSLGLFTDYDTMGRLMKLLSLKLEKCEHCCVVKSANGRFFQVADRRPVGSVYKTTEEFVLDRQGTAQDKLNAVEKLVIGVCGLEKAGANNAQPNS